MRRVALFAIGALVALGATSAPLAAQESIEWRVTPFVGGALYLSDAPEWIRMSHGDGVISDVEGASRDDGLAAGLHAGARVGRSLGIEGTFAYLPTTVSFASGGSMDVDSYVYGVSLLYSLPAKRRLEPFLAVGGGGKTYDAPGYETRTDLTVNFGGGLDVRLTPRTGLRLEARDYVSWVDPEIYGYDTEVQHDLVLTAGLSFTLPFGSGVR